MDIADENCISWIPFVNSIFHFFCRAIGKGEANHFFLGNSNLQGMFCPARKELCLSGSRRSENDVSALAQFNYSRLLIR